MGKKKTTEQFINECIKVHGDKYDYSLVEYENSLSKINIICKKHGVFSQRASAHTTQKQGCDKCRSLRNNTDNIIKGFNEIHGNKYDYSLVIYKGNNIKVQIICPIHGIFDQLVYCHSNGKGCYECGKKTKGINRTLNASLNKFTNVVQPEEYKIIPLTKGYFAKVDNEDFEELSKYNWVITTHKYASSGSVGLMSRFIMKANKDELVDHINHDTLDNRRNNLRIANKSENGMNLISKRRNKTSLFKGVSWNTQKNKWVSQIGLKMSKIYLGSFLSEIEAAKAYDKKAKELFGEFAHLNFIND